MDKTVFITGNSKGIGYSLTKEALTRKWTVYGLSRRGCGHLQGALHDVKCDLQIETNIAPALEKLFNKLKHLDLVILNAGVLGEINHISQTSIESLKTVMDINVWANKVILDWLHNEGVQIAQVIAISSGVAINGYKGWGGYTVSKAVFKELIEIYANQYTAIHFTSLAPGLVDTSMQDYICDESIVSAEEFPSVQKFRDARGTEKMSTPDEVAVRIMDLAPELLTAPSGSFVDLRNI